MSGRNSPAYMEYDNIFISLRIPEHRWHLKSGQFPLSNRLISQAVMYFPRDEAYTGVFFRYGIPTPVLQGVLRLLNTRILSLPPYPSPRNWSLLSNLLIILSHHKLSLEMCQPFIPCWPQNNSFRNRKKTSGGIQYQEITQISDGGSKRQFLVSKFGLGIVVLITVAGLTV